MNKILEQDYSKSFCPKCGYDYCICDVRREDYLTQTGTWFISDTQQIINLLTQINNQLTEIKQILINSGAKK